MLDICDNAFYIIIHKIHYTYANYYYYILIWIPVFKDDDDAVSK